MASQRNLTELEGAVLSEIEFRGNDTAYKVRRAFQTSPSSHWRGSAGAVSPAVRRLTSAGFIAAQPHGRRQGLRLQVTSQGSSALAAWAADLRQACGVGLDPFRLRSGLWLKLSAEHRARLLGTLQEMLEEEVRTLEARPQSDPLDRAQTELAIGLQICRLDWVRKQLAAS